MQEIHPLDDPASRAQIIEALSVTQQTLSNWKKRGVPVKECIQIEALTGIKCEALCPGLPWGVLRNSNQQEAA